MSLTELSASDLSRAIAARQAAPSEVMAAHLARTARANRAIKAVVALRDPDLLMAEARASDHVQPRNGLPLVVKDLQAVAGIRST